MADQDDLVKNVVNQDKKEEEKKKEAAWRWNNWWNKNREKYNEKRKLQARVKKEAAKDPNEIDIRDKNPAVRSKRLKREKPHKTPLTTTTSTSALPLPPSVLPPQTQGFPFQYQGFNPLLSSTYNTSIFTPINIQVTPSLVPGPVYFQQPIQQQYHQQMPPAPNFNNLPPSLALLEMQLRPQRIQQGPLEQQWQNMIRGQQWMEQQQMPSQVSANFASRVLLPQPNRQVPKPGGYHHQ